MDIKNLILLATVSFSLISIGKSAAALAEPYSEVELNFVESPQADPDLDTDGNISKIPLLKNRGVFFKHACDQGRKVTITAVGDVLIHGALAQQAMHSKIGFTSLWQSVLPLLHQGDLTYANLEGPVAGNIDRGGRLIPDPGKHWDNISYTSYPMFNYHPSLISDLIASRISVVSTANNHAMDRHPIGVDRTIDNLISGGLAYSGTRRSFDTQSAWYTVTEVQGFTIAWLACSWGTNGLPDPFHQVLLCYKDTPLIEALVSELSHNPKIDALIVTPHWGQEYTHVPGSDQKILAHKLLNAGATAVIGTHPHVIQPMEKFVTRDNRETFIIYSLGNFISGQQQVSRRTSIVLYLGLTKTLNGTTIVNGVRYVPTVMTYGHGIVLEPQDSGESQRLVGRLLGEENRIGIQEPLITNPQCP